MALVRNQSTASPHTTVSGCHKRSVKLAIGGWPDSDETQVPVLTLQVREFESASKRLPQTDIQPMVE